MELSAEVEVSGFERLGSVLDRIVSPPPGRTQTELGRVWAACVGADIAQNAQPLALRAGRLIVATSSPGWAQALQAMEEAILHRLNEGLAREKAAGRRSGNAAQPVTCLQFRAAGWEVVAPRAESHLPGSHQPETDRAPRPAARKNAPEPALPAPLEEEVRSVEASACNEQLARTIGAAMRAWLRAGGGVSGTGEPRS